MIPERGNQVGQTETNQTIGNQYFGVCPECHKNDGCINVGRSHWLAYRAR